MGSTRALVGMWTRPASLALAALAWAGPAAATAMFTGIGDLAGGAVSSQVFALSGDGATAVGRSASSAGLEAVRWTAGGGLQGLGSLTTPPADFATGVSDDGSAIGGLAASPLGGTEAFRWTSGGGMLGLGDLSGGAFDAQGLGMSGDGGTIIGHSESANGEEAFRWTSGTGMVGLGDLSGGTFASTARGVSADGSVIVGRGTSADGPEAYIWTQPTGMVPLGDLPGGAFDSIALGVSADGTHVVGSATPAGAIREAFRWSAIDGMVPLGDLPGGDVNSTAFAVSADGRVIGGTGALTFNNAGDRAVVWIDDALYDVKTLLEAEYGLDLGDWILVGVRGVSDDGLVWAGNGINPDGDVEGWIASVSALPAVPEPPLLALLAGAAAGLWRRAGRGAAGA